MSFQRARQKCLDSNFNSGLIAAIRLQISKSMYLRSLRKNLSFAEACQFLSCSHSGWPRKSVETVPL